MEETKTIDLNPIFDELHKQGFWHSRLDTIEDYIVLYPIEWKDEMLQEKFDKQYDKYEELRLKDILIYTWLTQEEINDFSKMTKEEKEQIKYTVKYKRLKQELEELENKIN